LNKKFYHVKVNIVLFRVHRESELEWATLIMKKPKPTCLTIKIHRMKRVPRKTTMKK